MRAPIAAAPARPAPPKEPSRTREEFEAFVGGKLLNRIGALALVMGVGFFLKYAFDNNWITESMRVVIGFMAGIGVLFTGVRTHKKGFAIFAQGLFGAGISILYLSVYASFNFYHLVPQAVAFGVMSVVTILGFLIAVRYDSLAISLLAWAGGFLTPFMLSTGSANEVGLFTYILLLQAGLLALVMRKPAWSVLGILTLAGTYLVFFAWQLEYYAAEKLAVTLLFATAFWLLFFLFDLVQTGRHAGGGALLRQAMNLFNACLYYEILYDLIDHTHHEWMGATSLALALAYFAQVLLLRRAEGSSAMVGQSLFLSLILVVLATGIQYTGFTTVILWSLESALLVWCARHWKSLNVAYFAMGLLACAALKLGTTADAFGFEHVAEFVPVWNYRALTYAALGVSLCASAVILRRPPAADVGNAVIVLDGAWIATLLALATVEIKDWYAGLGAGAGIVEQEHFRFMKFMMIAVAWAVLSLPIVIAGFRARLWSLVIPGLLIVSTAMWLGLLKGISYAPIGYYSPIFNVRCLALLAVTVSMALHYRWLARSAREFTWARGVGGTVAIAAILLFLALLTGETRDLFELQIFHVRALAPGSYDELSRLENLKQLSLSGLWMLYGGVLMGVGLWLRRRGLRIAAIALLGIAILKIFIYDLSFLEPLYRIFSFIGLGVILLAASYVYQKYKSLLIEDSPPPAGGP